MNIGSNLFGTSSLSLFRILGSVSKALGVVKQVVPLYNDIKPMFKNVPNLFQRFSSIREAAYKMKTFNDTQYNTYNQELISHNLNSGGPTFFQ